MINEITSLVGKFGQAQIEKDEQAQIYYKNMLVGLINQRINDINAEIKDMAAVRVLISIIIPDEQPKADAQPEETKSVQEKPKKKVGRKRKVKKVTEAAPAQEKTSESSVADDGDVKKDLAKGNPWTQKS